MSTATVPVTPGQLRSDLKAWLSEHGDGFALARADAEPLTIEETMAADLVLQRALWDAGFTRYGWPPSVGGLGGTAILRAAVYEQLVLAGFRVSLAMLTVETLGPVMVALAPEVSARYLPACLRGDEVWCQGFSEPEAGSDLASLRCRAEPVDGGFALSGQKVWSSLGTMAQRTALLARTGGAGHRGISMMLVDLDGPGCEVRPIRASSGRNEFAELFFDSTPVSRDRLIGDVDGGWSVAMSLLQWERGMYAWQRQATLHFLLAETVRQGPDLDPGPARLVANAWISLTALRQASARTVSRLANGENPGPEISVDKILLATTEQEVFEACRRLRPTEFAFGDGPGDQVARADWFYSRMATIYGGAIEIQRSIVAERVLGLPRAGGR
ncbi:MAG TPA: acyl-CoA dehydrogenase family protein [Acidimicrobiales bacterium]|jgi:alkylation response protein AidB-like acyl-CoA dehydrogenase|nr:acyl-CoA dehydrogenase family protein [Acidimicrobiales bacterium]